MKRKGFHPKIAKFLLILYVVALAVSHPVPAAAEWADSETAPAAWTPPDFLPATANTPAQKLVSWDKEKGRAVYEPLTSPGASVGEDGVFLRSYWGLTPISECGRPFETIKRDAGWNNIVPPDDCLPAGTIEGHGDREVSYWGLTDEGKAAWSGSHGVVEHTAGDYPHRFSEFVTMGCPFDHMDRCQNLWGQVAPWTYEYGWNQAPPDPEAPAPVPEPAPEPDPFAPLPAPAPVDCPINETPGPDEPISPTSLIRPDPGLPQPPEPKPWFVVNGRTFCDPAGQAIRLLDVPGVGKQLLVDAHYLAIALNTASPEFMGIGHQYEFETWPEQDGHVVKTAGLGNARHHIVATAGANHLELWAPRLDCDPQDTTTCGGYTFIRNVRTVAPVLWGGYKPDSIEARLFVPFTEAVIALGGQVTGFSPVTATYNIPLADEDFVWANVMVPADYGLYQDYQRGLFNKGEIILLRNMGLFKHQRYAEDGETPNMWAIEVEPLFIQAYWLRMVSYHNTWDLTPEQETSITEWINFVLGYRDQDSQVPWGWREWEPGVSYTALAKVQAYNSGIYVSRRWTREQARAQGHRNRALGQTAENAARVVFDRLMVADPVTGYRLSHVAYSKQFKMWLPDMREAMEGVTSDMNGPDLAFYLTDTNLNYVGDVFPNVKGTTWPYVAPFRFFSTDNSPLDVQIDKMTRIAPTQKQREIWQVIQKQHEAFVEETLAKQRAQLAWDAEQGRITNDEYERLLRQINDEVRRNARHEVPTAVAPNGLSPTGERKLSKLNLIWVAIRYRTGVVRTNMYQVMRGMIKFPFKNDDDDGKPPMLKGLGPVLRPHLHAA